MKMERNLCVKEKRANVRRICPVREGPKEPGEEEYRDINWGGTAERFGPYGIGCLGGFLLLCEEVVRTEHETDFMEPKMGREHDWFKT